MRQKRSLIAVEEINKALNLELEPGHGWLSMAADEHIRTRHPADYDICLKHLDAILSQPDWVGQKPSQPDSFELISKVTDNGENIILVAVSIERNAFGNYQIRSAYRLQQHDLDRRRRNNLFKRILKREEPLG